MNTPVTFSIAKLLKEKGFNSITPCFYFEDGEFSENIFTDTHGPDYGSPFTVQLSELMENWNDKFLTKKNGGRCFGCTKDKGYFETFSAPAISDILMWLYEKHDIWISVNSDKALNWESLFSIKIDWIYPKDSPDSKDIEPKYFKYKEKNEFNSPTEAYLAGIKYCLEKII